MEQMLVIAGLLLVIVWVMVTTRDRKKLSLFLGFFLIVVPNILWMIQYGYGRDWERRSLKRIEELISEGKEDVAGRAINSCLTESSGSGTYLGGRLYQKIKEEERNYQRPKTETQKENAEEQADAVPGT